MRTFSTFLVLCALGSPILSGAQGTGLARAKAPSRIELRDQFNVPQSLTFPTTNVIVLLIADRKGSEQVDGWVAVLKPKCQAGISMRGLAIVAGVPKFLQGRVCKEFQARRKYPVWMDWSGKLSDQFGYRPEVANVLLIEPDGVIRARFEGSATASNAAEALRVLDSLRAAQSAQSPSPGHANV